MISEFLTINKENINDELKLFLDENITSDHSKKMISYSLINSGKRLRPLSSLYIYNILNKSEKSFSEELIKLANTVELIHGYSLIHDDLPALDNDDLRRGKNTPHKEFGEDMAILMGDSILTLAFKKLSDVKIDNDKKVFLLNKISDLSGINHLVDGQIMDIKAEHNNVYEMDEVSVKKTGSLFALSFMIPLVFLGKDQKSISQFEEIGFKFGKAFQVLDDINDLKQKSDDNKKTYNSFLNEKEIFRYLKEIISDIKKEISEIDLNNEQKQRMNEFIEFNLTN